MKSLDWVIVGIYAVLIGLYFTRRSSSGIGSYFVGGRLLKWCVIGFSTGATFTSEGPGSASTMLIYIMNCLRGNCWWWIPWMIWMPLVAVICSKFWQRLRIVSTAEFVEVRHGGNAASIFVPSPRFTSAWAGLWF